MDTTINTIDSLYIINEDGAKMPKLIQLVIDKMEIEEIEAPESRSQFDLEEMRTLPALCWFETDDYVFVRFGHWTQDRVDTKFQPSLPC